MISPESLFGLEHYEYGEAYYGSCCGMRFRLARQPLINVHFTPPEERDPSDRLMATVWPEPYSYQDTDDSLKRSEFFPVTKEGYEAAVRWLNSQADDFSGGAA